MYHCVLKKETGNPHGEDFKKISWCNRQIGGKYFEIYYSNIDDMIHGGISNETGPCVKCAAAIVATLRKFFYDEESLQILKDYKDY